MRMRVRRQHATRASRPSHSDHDSDLAQNPGQKAVRPSPPPSLPWASDSDIGFIKVYEGSRSLYATRVDRSHHNIHEITDCRVQVGQLTSRQPPSARS